jgi:hypothetical protein
VLQEMVCWLLPAHILPPFTGAGSVHARLCVNTPPPQLCEHDVMFTQSDQPPSPVAMPLELPS